MTRDELREKIDDAIWVEIDTDSGGYVLGRSEALERIMEYIDSKIIWDDGKAVGFQNE